jgi:ABC-type phosphate transport system substrate-binding protein
MRIRRVFLSVSAILVAAIFLATPCFAHHIAVVVDKDNKTQNITSAHLVKILKGEVKKWPDGKSIVLVLHETPDEITTLARLTKMTDAEVKAMIEERKDSIMRKASDADVIDAVASTAGAIGMVVADA